MNVSARPDDPDMTPHDIIETLITAKAGPDSEYRDLLATTTVALAHRPDLSGLAAVLDLLVDEAAFARHKSSNRKAWADA